MSIMATLTVQDAAIPQAPPKIRLQEFPHAHILAETLAPPGLEHEVPRRRHRARHLQRPSLGLSVQRIARHDTPAVEDQAHRRLALRVDADVGFEAEAVNHRDEAPDAVQGCPCDGAVGKDVASTPGEDGVEGGDGVGGSGHRDGVEGFEEAGGGGQEGRVKSTARGGDYLATAARDAIGG